MNTTDTYIGELLYRYECVIVPGFGAFLTRRQPASIDEVANAFYPPKKIISFNRQLQNNDGLLANYIATAEQISYTDAVAKIQRYVLSIKDKIAQGNRVELQSIGAFFTSVENTLQFEPLETINYLIESFGLSSFVSPQIVREPEIVIQREMYKEEVEAIEEKTPVIFTPEKRSDRPYLQYAAAAAIFIGVVSLFGLKHISDKNIEHNQNLLVQANQEIENKIQEATFEIANPLPAINLNIVKENSETPLLAPAVEKENETSNVAKFHIIAGAYRIPSNAERKVNELTSKGFKAHLIGVNKYGLHQVAYASYANRNDAIQALRRIKNEETSKAWMLVQ